MAYNQNMNFVGTSGDMDYDDEDEIPYIKPPVRIFIPREMIGEIIGSQGSTLRTICGFTGARINIHRNDNSDAAGVQVSITGWEPTQCTEACKQLLEVMQHESTITLAGETSLKLMVRSYLNDGLTDMRYLRNIMALTDTVITTSVMYEMKQQSLDYIINIKGTIENKVKAEALISEKIRNNYNILFSQDEKERVKKKLNISETTYMYIPSYAMHILFGLDGTYLNTIMSKSKATISICPHILGDPQRIICITGNPAEQDMAQLMIYQRLLSEGFTWNIMKIDVTINPAIVGRIIGRSGRVIGSMRRLTGTAIDIPYEHVCTPGNLQIVRIVGSYHGVENAQKRIRLIVEEYMIEEVILAEKIEDMKRQIPP